jgi:hypothetical protein
LKNYKEDSNVSVIIFRMCRTLTLKPVDMHAIICYDMYFDIGLIVRRDFSINLKSSYNDIRLYCYCFTSNQVNTDFMNFVSNVNQYSLVLEKLIVLN